MIDLRSDTLTKPCEEMKRAMYHADSGDDGRSDASGRSEDPTVRKLEDLAAEISGHEAALFCSSGTIANYVAIMTHGLNRDDKILIDRFSHLYRSEKALFMDRLLGLTPSFYSLDELGIPDSQIIESHLKDQEIKLLSFENTHNAHGGTCISAEQTNIICETARQHDTPVHLDGARVFNAAVHFNIDVRQLTSPPDSVMFCLSKGLGAPGGSMLCGTKAFIYEARKMRKILGGSLRQAGILAAAGIVALENNIEMLETDHRNALYLAKEINEHPVKVDLETVQTNIINADISSTGLSSIQIKNDLEEAGLRLNAISDEKIRLVTQKDISETEIKKSVHILKNYFDIP